MSVEVHQFLDNSGGSNFTERTPRPPVGPGEENELHSTGGHSNKSSGSHKSFTSNRSNGSGTGGATPRRLQKPAKLPPTTVSALQPSASTVGNGEKAVENEAPLGFEPEGSAGEQQEFTEGTPSYTRWSENIDYVLEDADGVDLFQKYLTQESSVELFEFYFAWKYLKRLDADDMKAVGSFIKTMYKAFIKGDKTNRKLTLICKETREAIVKLVTTKEYSLSIFDVAKDEVLDVLKREFYLPFLNSNIYLQYIQSMEESPKDSANSSGSVSIRPLSTALATVPEHSELELSHLTTTSDHHMTSDAPVLTLTAQNMQRTERLRMETKIKPENQAGYYLQKDSPLPPHPYDSYNTSYLPISAIDSERQSVSSEALTDDTHSITDSSVDGFPQFNNSRSVSRYHRKIKARAQRNRESDASAHHNFIPSKNNRLSKVSNIAETNPMEFAKILSDRLERVLEDRAHSEMFHCKLNAMSEDDGTTDDSQSMLSSTTGGVGAKSTTLKQLLGAIQAGDQDAEAQDILDMHCKRIWERSGQHTPAKSPSRSKSPEHMQHNATMKKAQSLPRQTISSGHAPPSLAYNKPASVPTKPLNTLPGFAPYSMDNSYPVTSATAYNKSNSRHGMATFSSKAEQQSIFTQGTSTHVQKVAEWISRNEEIMQHATIHAPPESDKSSFRRSSQRSLNTTASPRASRNKTHKGAGTSSDCKRATQDDKHSFKSKSSASSSKDKRSMSKSASDASAMMGGARQQQTLTQRKGVLAPPQLKVAFFLIDEPIPYSVTVNETELTLGKFKDLVTKKGNYRYFFKKATNDEFGQDVPHVLEEITNDNQILPKWESKVVCHIKKRE
ncbi:axin-1-like isoform X2 [Watersipora subatra]|uniref:axin-1-like isoform X2 n=1 Tax=Watersipora subatra TaxID=2589382 RepID=UPI00355B17B9